jgi:Cd2+/Zn2+-exporting ATPase
MMQKTRINLDILLPEIPDERDECVNRIINTMHLRRGIDKIHVIPANGGDKAQLCFHYDPEIISINEVEKLASKTGIAITDHYGHLLIDVSGIRHPRHARLIETQINAHPGIVSVSASASGFIQLEYDKESTTEKDLLNAIRKLQLKINGVDDFHQLEMKNGHAHAHVHVHTLDHAHADHTHAHDGSHVHAHDHSHAHGGIFGEKSELIFAIICGSLLVAGFALSFVSGISTWIPVGFYVGAYLFGGYYTTKEAIAGIMKGDFEIDFLMLVAAIGAAILGHWPEGALLLFLFSLGHSLEHYAMDKARKSIESLTDLAPKTAQLKIENELREVKIEELEKGDIIVIKPHSKISADGMVISGNSSVNQAPITGESIPVDKRPAPDPVASFVLIDKLDAQHKVYAGSINGSEVLEIKVSKIAADSTIARLIRLVNEAQTQKSPTQHFTDRLEKYYVPAVLILIFLLNFAFLVIDEPFSKSFYRAMAVLVAASPCALAISTPSAVLSGVARAARGGVLVKGGRPLEELGSLTAIAFDKTGTLTEGKPKLTGIFPLNGIAENDLLQIVIAVERLSDHPLAVAIVNGVSEKLHNEVETASQVEAITGRGIQAIYKGNNIQIGNKELFKERNYPLPDDIKAKVEALEKMGNTTMLVQQNGRYIGVIALMDVARSDAADTLTQLKKLGIRKMIMLTGDNQQVAEAVAKKIGITDAWGNLLPEQKVEAINKLKKSEQKVAMVGDGVNDAPAMANSTVGIAMGAAGSDVALETADIALMADQLNNLPFAIGLSKKAHKIIRQNVLISLGMVVLLIPLTMSGIAHMGPAVIGHEGSTIVVVFNALRLLAYKR